MEARAACEAIGARLCRIEEWQRACGGAEMESYPYGNRSIDRICNGGKFDTDADTVEDDDGPLPCGNRPECVRDGIYDLSGNLKEWVNDGIDNLRSVRGGSFETDTDTALTCQNAGDYKAANFQHRSIGFRCCRDLNDDP